ncbi:hypothetical protein AL711_02850 [Clostridium botulinum]|nr:hypothetical protein AL711_02850 [Clostridium botulinum]
MITSQRLKSKFINKSVLFMSIGGGVKINNIKMIVSLV